MGYGHLAKLLYGQRLPLCIIKISNGYIVGTCIAGILVTRESVESWRTREAVIHALAVHRWTQASA